jgi:predicted branched-subunit amino acid permease
VPLNSHEIQSTHSVKPLRKRAFKDGVNTVLVTVPGNFAWGFVVGLGMINLGLSVFESAAFNVLVYSGSAQMVAMPLMAAKASLSLVFLASFMACIRFVLYSAAMAPVLHHLPLKQRLFVSAFSIDAAIGLFLVRREQSTRGVQSFPHRISFLMGMNALIWSAWTSGVFAGIFAAGLLPSSSKFSYLGIVALFGIAIGMMRSRASVACAIASAVVAVLASSWPFQLGLLTAILVGIATGFAVLAREHNPQ